MGEAVDLFDLPHSQIARSVGRGPVERILEATDVDSYRAEKKKALKIP